MCVCVCSFAVLGELCCQIVHFLVHLSHALLLESSSTDTSRQLDGCLRDNIHHLFSQCIGILSPGLHDAVRGSFCCFHCAFPHGSTCAEWRMARRSNKPERRDEITPLLFRIAQTECRRLQQRLLHLMPEAENALIAACGTCSPAIIVLSFSPARKH